MSIWHQRNEFEAGFTYKVVERKCDAFDFFVSSINKARNSKVVRLVYGTRTGDGMDHRPSDYVRINDA